MFQQQATVLWNKQVGPVYYKIGLTCSGRYAAAKPGQFVMLRIPGHTDPLLRRPFSIHSLRVSNGVTDGFELLYRVVGKTTKLLAMQKPGDSIDVLGPLGSSFIVPRQAKRIYVAAGGIGVAPMVFLVSDLRRNKFDLDNCRVFLGGRTKEDLLCRDEFDRLGVSVHTSTDDGSAGDQCLLTHPLEAAIDQIAPDLIAACGPMDMLVCVVGIAEKYHVPCQVSIETMMACGMGACLGCAVECRTDPDRYLHACLDGPVFNGDELKI
jgi:dihydroorotate dehydrogenase electron transfer subunit